MHGLVPQAGKGRLDMFEAEADELLANLSRLSRGATIQDLSPLS